MLQQIREKTTGWIATIILGLLIITVGFLGAGEYMSRSVESAVAKVEAPPSWWASAPAWWPASLLWEYEEVSQDEFRAAFEQARQRERETLGETFDPRSFETTENKLVVLDQLIDQKILKLAARGAGVVVGDEAVRQAIASEPAFQVDGKFDPNRYALLLSSQVPALSPVQFQAQQRERMQLGLIPQGITGSAFITPQELDHLVTLLGETRDITIAALPPPSLDDGEVTDAQIKAWYDSHPADFKQGESVTLEYVEIEASALPVVAADDEAALRQRYEQEKSRFMSAEQRMASHILITVPADADAATRDAALKKATSLTAQAKAPSADFAAIAKANSEDPGSRDAGGDLGWVDKGVMAKPFEDALFAMQSGEIRGPVQTDFGYHVLQLREIKAGEGKSFEEARGQLAQEQGEAAGERAFNDLAGRMVNEVLKNPTALGPAARSEGLQVQKLGPFSRATASGIAANPAVLRAAFSDALVQDGTVSDPIEIGPRHSVLIRVLEHTPEAAQPLAQVRDAVIAAIRSDRTDKAANAAADALLARVAKGESLKDIAAAQKLQSGVLPGLPRGAPMPSAEINTAVFEARPAAEGQPATGKARLQNGDYAVFVVDKVNEGDVTRISPEERKQLQEQIVGLQGESGVQSFISALRKNFRVTRHEDRF